jgi:hypothetical protein
MFTDKLLARGWVWVVIKIMNKQDNCIKYWGYSTLDLVLPIKAITRFHVCWCGSSNIIVMYCVTVNDNNLSHKHDID